MFTKNWYGLFGYHNLGADRASLAKYFTHYSGSSIGGTTNQSLNTIKTLMSSAPAITDLTTTSSNSASGVYFGDGTAAPTFDDYKLSGNWLKVLSCAPVVTFEYQDGSVIATGIYTITNGSDSDFTVSEIGIIQQTGFASAGTYYYKLLLERTVLDTPVTIPAGGVGQVTYKIRLNFPTA